jgi:hypothetical protein
VGEPQDRLQQAVYLQPQPADFFQARLLMYEVTGETA